jgi:CRISPR-associated endonuclease/helicase Cas3
MDPNNANDLHLKLWAKSRPFHPLWKHLLDIAAVCKALLPRFGGVDCLPEAWVLFLVALHDIGKAAAKFQGKAPVEAVEAHVVVEELRNYLPIAGEAECQGFRHEARSATWLRAYLVDKCGWPRQAADTMRLACVGHHGNFAAKDDPDEYEEGHEHEREAWQSQRAALARLVADVLGVEPWVPSTPIDASAAGIKMVGLTVLADWIASNHEVFDYTQAGGEVDPQHYYAWAVVEAERVVAKLQLDAPEIVTTEGGFPFSEVWPECIELRPTQRALEAAVRAGIAPGLAIIEAPMGEGKTECAIYLAEYWNRIRKRSGCYFALPTQATSNQMHERYKRFLKHVRPRYEPRLVHGMAWMLDDHATDDGPETDAENATEERILARDWFANAKRALLAPEAVGTVDQAMFGALNVKHGFLRLLGLSSRVLVIDECHAYDMYMTKILEMLLQWCRALNIPVILLSATLSRTQKGRLLEAYTGRPNDELAPVLASDAYPLLTFAPLDGEPAACPVERDPARATSISTRPERGLLGDPVGTARLAEKLVRDGGCVCVLCNTVRDAQDVYRALQPVVDSDVKLILYHARFRAEVRQEIEEQVLGLFGKAANGDLNQGRPPKAILVATQVVEQSLDVDFDVMISQIGPIDLLLQRVGRVHRHNGNPRHGHTFPVLHILLPTESMGDYGVTAKVYQPELLLKTEALLAECDSINLPEDFRPMIEGCYGECNDSSWERIPEELLADAIRQRRDTQQKQTDHARKFLLAAPSPKQFQPALDAKPVEEAGEEGAASYLRASTRFGDDSMPTLILHDRALYDMATTWPKIPRKRMRELFRHKVNLSAYRLTGTTPQPGYLPIECKAPALCGHAVVFMQDGCWRGMRGDKPVDIIDHPDLGIIYEEVE